MTKYHPTAQHDYLPAAGRDTFLPYYDLFTSALGVGKIHRTLIGQAGLTAGQRVLEIGCGTGNLAVRLKRSQPGVEVVGSDPDPLALARAQSKARHLDGIRFERGYAQRLPYADDNFERVLSSFMLHHLDPETKAAAAAEVARVLRPGGRLHVVDMIAATHGLHGFLAQRMTKSSHAAANADDRVPRLLDAVGLECTSVLARRHPVMGRIGYYRAQARA